jgi:uncharacterized protein with NRDE domain
MLASFVVPFESHFMCLIFLGYEIHSDYRLIIAANRDEFYNRPSAPADYWEEAPDILGGKDLRSGGTWLGITKTGRLAAVTNYRDPKNQSDHAPSRGFLVSDYLKGRLSPLDYLKRIRGNAYRYNGFNLIVGDTEDLYYFSNRGRDIERLEPGLYGLSNHFLNTPWWKVEQGKRTFHSIMNRNGQLDPDDIFEILSDHSQAPDECLPNTGVGVEWERILSSPFIVSPVYGTRSSTVILIDRKENALFIERIFTPGSHFVKTIRYGFKISS